MTGTGSVQKSELISIVWLMSTLHGQVGDIAAVLKGQGSLTAAGFGVAT